MLVIPLHNGVYPPQLLVDGRLPRKHPGTLALGKVNHNVKVHHQFRTYGGLIMGCHWVSRCKVCYNCCTCYTHLHPSLTGPC